MVSNITRVEPLTPTPVGMRPKKPSCSFLQYLLLRRQNIISANPNMNSKQIANIACQEWMRFSDKEKEPYVNLYQKY